MNSIKAILFDMDGLIFDSEGLYKTCWQQAVSQQGLVLDDDYYQQFIGVQDSQCEVYLERRFSSKLNLKQFRHDRDTLLQIKGQQSAPYKPGFQMLFSKVKEMELKCALVTSSSLAKVRHHFTDDKYLSQFDSIITSEKIENGKPQPDCYIMAYKQLNILPQHCLVLEDSNNGMRAALKAGCLAIMIPDLQQPATDVATQATAILTSLKQVKQLIAR